MTHLTPGQHIHFVGIGGIGLSAVARILLQKGYRVTGSDRASNDLTRALASEGVATYVGHDAANIGDADALIISSAVSADNPEVTAARVRGTPIYKRSDIIGDVTEGQAVIAIAGTHGKTTTTAMTAHILIESGGDPSYIVGGILQRTGRNANLGSGGQFVIEADEYDDMFLGLTPQTAVITNIEWDHPDFFHTPEDVMRAFARFADRVPPDGLLIACGDDPWAFELAYLRRGQHRPAATYSLMDAPFSGNRGRFGRGRLAGRSLVSETVGENPQGLWRAVNVRPQGNGTAFELLRWGTSLGTVTLPLPGKHNVLNAMAAVIAAFSQGVPAADAIRALASFEGTSRRFELRGEVDGIAVIDDYAHHPTAIRATLQAARQRYPDRTIWVVWQPHTFSRLRSLWSEYLNAFGGADHLLVTDIYAAREDPLPGVTGEAFAADIVHADVHHTPSLDDAVAVLDASVHPYAVVLILSAGDATWVGEEFLRRRQDRAPGTNDTGLAIR